MDNEIGGVWRTIAGRRVFIKDGQNLSDAMKKSGKFKVKRKKDDIDKYEESKEKFDKYKKDMQTARTKFYEELGYDGKPEVVSEEEFEKMSKGQTIITRSTNEERYKNLVSGKYEVSTPENSMYGTGIYFAYAEEDIAYYRGLSNNNKVFDAIVKKDAKMIDSRELNAIKDKIKSKVTNRQELDYMIWADDGLFASMLGYDGVWIDNVKYALVMNRGKLVINKEGMIKNRK